MRVVHLTSGPLGGGANRGAVSLHKGLRAIGVDSHLVTNDRDDLGDSSIQSLARSMSGRILHSALPRVGRLPVRLYRQRDAKLFSTGFEGVPLHMIRGVREADVIHLHWINGLVSTRHIGKLGKPVVWTLRDMWPMTGGCHYAMGCESYSKGCGACPQLGSEKQRDLSAFIVNQKQRSFGKNVFPVGISEWISNCARNSTVFKDHSVQTIPNCIDTNVFFPVEVQAARKALGIPNNRNVLLVGAQNISDFYKGGDLLKSSLSELAGDDIFLLTFGKASEFEPAHLGYEGRALGFLNDEISLRVAYSAADVFLASSRMEAFGKTLTEAMACGTPCVCFDATGPKDIVDHKANGYLARPFDTMDLIAGVRWLFGQSQSQRIAISYHARKKVEFKFDAKVIAEQYREFYKGLV